MREAPARSGLFAAPLIFFSAGEFRNWHLSKPRRDARSGCRGFFGPVPRPLWMRPGRVGDPDDSKSCTGRYPGGRKCQRRAPKGLACERSSRVGRSRRLLSRKEPKMIPILAFSLLLLTADPPDSPWVEVRLTIVRDPYSSSDQVTVCRVRAVNLGGRTWSGRTLAFEARAVGGGRHTRARGRFGSRARAPRIARDAHRASRPPRPLRGRPDHAEGLRGGAGAEGAAQALAPPPKPPA